MKKFTQNPERGPTANALFASLLTAACGLVEAKPEEQAMKLDAATDSARKSPTSNASGVADLVGCWDMVVSLPLKREGSGKLCFSNDGADTLSARVLIRGEWRTAKTVRTAPGHVELELEGPFGDATVSADYTQTTMTGSIEGKPGKRPFRAQRAAD